MNKFNGFKLWEVETINKYGYRIHSIWLYGLWYYNQAFRKFIVITGEGEDDWEDMYSN